MNTTINRRALGAALLVVAGVLLFMGAIITGSQMIAVPVSVPAIALLFRISLMITILGAILFGVLLGVLVYVGIVDHDQGHELSRLYPALVAKAAVLFAFFILASVGAVDSLIHDLQPRWMLANQPEVRITYAALYLGVVAGFGWMLGSILHGRGLRTLAILSAYAAMALGAAGLIAIALITLD